MVFVRRKEFLDLTLPDELIYKHELSYVFVGGKKPADIVDRLLFKVGTKNRLLDNLLDSIVPMITNI